MLLGKTKKGERDLGEEKEKWAKQKENLTSHLEEAYIQLENNEIVLEKATAKANAIGFAQGEEERSGFFRDLLGLLAPREFRREGFFEASVCDDEGHC